MRLILKKPTFKIGLEDMIEMLMEDWITPILLLLWDLIVSIIKKQKKKKNKKIKILMKLILEIRLCQKFSNKIARDKWSLPPKVQKLLFLRKTLK